MSLVSDGPLFPAFQAPVVSPDLLGPAGLLQSESKATPTPAQPFRPSRPKSAAATNGNDQPAAQAEPLFDWNLQRPDGTLASLEAALQRLGQAFGGTSYVAYCEEGSTQLEFHLGDASGEVAVAAGLRAALTEAMAAGPTCLFATVRGNCSPVLEQLRISMDVRHETLVLGFAAPAMESHPDSLSLRAGVIICADAAAFQTQESYRQRIAEAKMELPEWLSAWLAARAGKRVAGWRRRLRALRSWRSQLIALTVGVLICCLAIPLPYWPQRICVVEPASRRFLASPIDGRLRNSLVRPGDVVQRGELLASLDDEQLRWELSAAKAELEAAGKRRDAALAKRSGGEMRLAQLEQERIALEIDSLTRQLERLELRSPSDGIIVQGDWFQSDGAPVSRGDTLFEIAPMDRMQIEIHLSTSDLATIQAGDQATIRVDAAPGESWSSDLTRIDPRGNVIQGEVVFVAEIEVDNRASLLRPGMQGTARIAAGYKPLAWLLFHRPYLWLMKKLAW